MINNGKRFIEETFPVKEVSQQSAREKNIRHGHISTLHIWWARRPLASSRATSYAALIPAPSGIEEWDRKSQFIAEFCRWENSLNQMMIERARKDILQANGGKPPRVLDPFAGGGAIPLEALRLGCETFASDYNPVATLILKCTLEYPQKYGKPGEVEREVEEFGRMREEKITVPNKLLEEVKRWAAWVLEQARKEIGKFYPIEDDGSIPVGYIWARTIPCQNPTCGKEIPLMRQFWLAKKPKKKVAVYPYVENERVNFKIVGDGYEKMPDDFDPSQGTIARAVATCPMCGSTVDAPTTRRLFQEGKAGQKMVAVVLRQPGVKGKRYRLATEKDLSVFEVAGKYLRRKREELRLEWGMDPVPDEPLPPVGTLGFRIQRYGMNTWGDLFNARQKLALITFAQKVRQAHQEMLNNEYDEEYARVVVSYLVCIISRLIDQSTVLVPWITQLEAVAHTFNRQALGMVWDYIEAYPFAYFSNATDWVCRVLDQCSQIPNSQFPIPNIIQASATSLSYSDNYFDAVFTDPPYYDNVPYSYLSDFFYVWLKRTVGHLYPGLFSTPLTPKKNEIVAYSKGPGGFEEGKKRFEDMLKQSFREINRVLKPNGITVIVYAHKSTEGWETLINSLLDSGLIMTGAWPLHTEMQARLRAKDSAALASSIYIVARKMNRQPTGFYTQVREKLKDYLNRKLERLWEEGVSGADFFIAAIGSAIEVFGKYEKVMDYEGNIVRADRLLGDVRKIATDYAVRQILHNGFSGEISDLTRFYVLYRWNYGMVKVHFDEARKLAQSCKVSLEKEWTKNGFIKKEKEFIRVLGPQERKPDSLASPSELIDVLHEVLLLWEKGRGNEMMNLLKTSGYGKSEAFYRVAQAISETLSLDNKEKKLLDGFLAGRERMIQEMRSKSSLAQGRLFE